MINTAIRSALALRDRLRALRAAKRRVAFCTLATVEYVPWVRVLFESLARHHPDAPRVFLYVRTPGSGPAPEMPGAHVIEVGDLVHPELEATLRRRYNQGELCFSLKPRLLSHVLDHHGERAIYIDADMDVLRPLDVAIVALEGAAAVVTPHLDVPIPEDGRLPSEVTILRAGTCNLGFVGVREGGEARALLAWWDARSIRWGFMAPFHGGYHGDQRWMDLAMGFFPGVSLLRDAGYNVGAWNLHGRPITRRDGVLMAGDRPLAFYHFSGFDPDKPQRLSKYQNRHRLADHPELATLAESFAQRLRAARERHPMVPLPPGTEPAAPGVLPDSAYRARLELVNRPPDVAHSAGEEVEVAVRVVNESDVAWPAGTLGAPGSVALSWHVRDEKFEPLQWDNVRTPLPHDLPAGASIELRVGLRMPTLPGRYQLEIDLVQEGLAWFSLRGSATLLLEAWVDRFPEAT